MSLNLNKRHIICELRFTTWNVRNEQNVALRFKNPENLASHSFQRFKFAMSRLKNATSNLRTYMSELEPFLILMSAILSNTKLDTSPSFAE